MGDFKTDTCNDNCTCAMSDYNPVCGSNDVMYYSPCFAGCQNLVTSTEDSQVRLVPCIMYYSLCFAEC